MDDLFDETPHPESIQAQDAGDDSTEALFDETPHPSVGQDVADSEVASQVQSAETPVETETYNFSEPAKTAASTALMSTGGALAGKGVQKAQQYIKESTPSRFLGPLTANDINFIAEDPARYTGAKSLEETLAEYKRMGEALRGQRMSRTNELVEGLQGTAKGVNQAAYDLAAQAKASAQGLPKVPRETLLKSVGKGLSELPGATIDVDPEEYNRQVKEAFGKNNLGPVANSLSSMDGEIRSIQEQMDQFQPGTDPHFELEQKLNQKLAQKTALEHKLASQTGDFMSQAQANVRQQFGLPEDILSANPELKNKRLAPGYSLDNVLKTIGNDPLISPERIAERGGIVQQLNDAATFDQAGLPTKDKLSTAIAGKVRQDFGALPEFAEYDKGQKMSSQAIETGEKLAKLGINPEGLSPSARNNISKWIDDPEKYGPELANLDEYLKSAEGVGVPVPQSYEDIKKLQSGENQFARAGAKPNTQTGVFEFPESKQGSFVETIAKGGNSDEMNNIVESIKSYGRSQGIPEDAIQGEIDNFLNQVKSGDIKQTVLGSDNPSLSAQRRIRSGATTTKPLEGIIGGTGAAAVESKAAKIQELLAQLKGSKFGKAAGTVADTLGKNAPLIGGAVGAMAGYSAAQAAGLSPEETLGVSAAEAVNPIPFTDIPQAYIQGKQASDRGEDLAGIAMEAGKGFVSPVKPAVEAFSQAGTERSLAARERMEKQLNAYKTLSEPKKINEQHASVQNMEAPQLQELASYFQGQEGGEAFGESLLKASQTDNPQTKSAILFGLHQQPAFRQMYRNKNNQPM